MKSAQLKTYTSGTFIFKYSFSICLNFYYRDDNGTEAWYEAISVIDFHGSISNSGESRGHYTCDVKDAQTQTWYRTNDDRNPVQIHINDVSRHGYVVLYKRIPV